MVMGHADLRGVREPDAAPRHTGPRVVPPRVMPPRAGEPPVGLGSKVHNVDVEDAGDLPQNLMWLSRTLARVLRHAAHEIGLSLKGSDGWCRVAEIMKKDLFKDHTEDDVKVVVQESFSKDRPRFELTDVDGSLWIRATHKHSIHGVGNRVDAGAWGGECLEAPQQWPPAPANPPPPLRRAAAGPPASPSPPPAARENNPSIPPPPAPLPDPTQKDPWGAYDPWSKSKPGGRGAAPKERVVAASTPCRAASGPDAAPDQKKQVESSEAGRSDCQAWPDWSDVLEALEAAPPKQGGADLPVKEEVPPPQGPALPELAQAAGPVEEVPPPQEPALSKLDETAVLAKEQVEAGLPAKQDAPPPQEPTESKPSEADLPVKEARGSVCWQKYQGDEAQGNWWWCGDTEEFFLESCPGEWAKYADPASGGHFWWKDDGAWFWEHTGTKLP